MPLKFLLLGSLLARPGFHLAPPTDPAGGGAPAPKGTLEEQLTAARSELATANASLATANASVTSLTAERDSARSERDQLQSQFNELTTTANQLRTDLAAANASVASLTTERDGLKSTLTTANANVTRLEALCGVKGLDPKASIPSVPEAAGAPKSEAEFTRAVASAKDNASTWSALESFGAAAKEGKLAK